MHQPSFFDAPEQQAKPKTRADRYPQKPGFAKNRETSKNAAAAVWEPTEVQQRILDAVRRNGINGLTDHEIAKALNMPMARVQPRRSQLSLMDNSMLFDSGQRRLSPYGRPCIVWVLADTVK